MKLLTPYQVTQLQEYRVIYNGNEYGDRAPELTKADELILQKIYNDWRGTTETIINCDECCEEVFERLMKQMIFQSIGKGDDDLTLTDDPQEEYKTM